MKPSELLDSLSKTDTAASETQQVMYMVGYQICRAIEELTTEVRRMTDPKKVLCQRPSGAPEGYWALPCIELSVREDEIDGAKVLVCQECYDDRRT